MTPPPRAPFGARALFAVLALGTFVVPLPSASGESTGETIGPRLSEDSVVVLEIALGRERLADAVSAYQVGEDLFFPFGAVARALGLAIVVDPQAARAEGFIIEESRRFTLDIAAGHVTIGEGREAVSPGSVAQEADDLYVTADTLERWLPIDLEFDSGRQVLTVKSRETLPIEARLLRESRGIGLTGASGRRAPLPPADDPYAVMAAPMADVSLAAEVTAADGESSRRTDYSLFVAGDALKATGSFALSGSDAGGVSDSRLALERRHERGGLLGDADAREFALGDVFSAPVPLVSQGGRGRGATISNAPIDRGSDFDQVDVRGELPLGWDVEIYRGDVLLGFARSRGDGLFEFISVPLIAGANVLRLVYYGPQGQRREETRRYFGGGELAAPGEITYRLSVQEAERDILGLRNTEDLDGAGEVRAAAELAFGLMRGLSANVVVARVPDAADGNGTEDFVGFGIKTDAGGAFTRLDLASSSQGTAAEIASQFKILGLSAFAQHAELSGFQSERFDGGADAFARTSEARLDGIAGDGAFALPFGLTLTRQERDSGRTKTVLGARLSARIGPTNASHTLTVERDEDAGPASRRSARGGLILSGRSREVSLRGTMDYDIRPVVRLTSIGATADYARGQEFRMSGTLSHERSSGTTTLGVGIARNFARFAVGLDGAYEDAGAYRLGVSLSSGFGRTPSGRFLTHPEGLARSGAVAAQVFIDNDGDGRMSVADEPLSGARLVRLGRTAVTDENGLAIFVGLAPFREGEVRLDETSLIDPHLVPSAVGYAVTARPGHVTALDFALTPTGEIDGVATLSDGISERPVGDVALDLVAADGEIKASARSGYDGFFLFEKVPPGHYTLTLSSDQAARLGLVAESALSVEITRDGNIVSGRRIRAYSLAKLAASEERVVTMATDLGGPPPER